MPKLFTPSRHLGFSLCSALLCSALVLLLPRVMVAQGTNTTSDESAPVTFALAVSSPSEAQSVPRLIMFSGTVKDLTGKPLTGPVDLNFAIYKEQTDAAPLWQESQTLNLDDEGRYTVLLGAMQQEGLPTELFTTGQARWLGLSAGKLPEQPRVLLVSVPYALKANDAEMLGGKPASSYALAQPTGASTPASGGTAGGTAPGGAITPDFATPRKPKSGPKPNVGGTGTQNYIPIWTDNSGTLGDSVMYQSGSNIGIGTTTPGYILDVVGGSARVANPSGTTQLTVSGSASSGRLGQDSSGFFFSSDTNGGAVRFLTNNGALNEWMRITSAGLVGIGTIGPVSALNVAGTTGLTWTSGGNNLGLVTLGTPATGGSLYLSTPSLNSSFQSGLGIDGTYGTPSLQSVINIRALGVHSGGGYGSQLAFWTTNGTAVNQQMTITNTGNVGIGTTAPAAKLEVNGTAQFDQAVTFQQPVTFAIGQTFTGDGSGLTNLTPANITSGTAGISITGNAATATSATTAATATNATSLIGVPGSSYARLDTANSYVGNQGISGNVGIGTAAGTRSLYVVSPASDLAAVKAIGQTASNVGNSLNEIRMGVWSDSASGDGLLATSDSLNAIEAHSNNTSQYPTGYFANNQIAGRGLYAGSLAAGCTIWGVGTISCTGGKAAEVPLTSGRIVRLYAIESPQVWFEDFGTGSLADGVAEIELDPVFADTVNPSMAYYVFLTPKGDCEGLYVAVQAPTGFEVRELRGGKSSVPFDYRVIALRKGYEKLRLEDVTDRSSIMSRAGAQPTTSGP